MTFLIWTSIRSYSTQVPSWQKMDNARHPLPAQDGRKQIDIQRMIAFPISTLSSMPLTMSGPFLSAGFI